MSETTSIVFSCPEFAVSSTVETYTYIDAEGNTKTASTIRGSASILVPLTDTINGVQAFVGESRDGSTVYAALGGTSPLDPKKDLSPSLRASGLICITPPVASCRKIIGRHWWDTQNRNTTELAICLAGYDSADGNGDLVRFETIAVLILRAWTAKFGPAPAYPNPMVVS